MKFFFIPMLLSFSFLAKAQDSLSVEVASTTIPSTSENTVPKNLQLSHIAIQGEFIDFTQLGDSEYQQKFPFGAALSQTFDSIVPFYNYPLTMELPYYLNDLTFHFSAIDWKNPHRIKYSFYLEGFEKDWGIPNHQSKASYQNLPYGNYTLKVRAKGDEPTWSPVFEYTFSIKRPWWHTWWAYLSYFLLFATMGIVLYNFMEQRKKEAAQVKHLLAENRLLAFSNRPKKKTSPLESSFLDQVQQILEAHLSDENFGIAELCEVLKISRAQLHRKLKKLTGQSTSHYIRSLRLDIAKGLLEKTNLNVSEVAFRVGFSSANYFSKVFKEEFGYAPKDAR